MEKNANGISKTEFFLAMRAEHSHGFGLPQGKPKLCAPFANRRMPDKLHV